MTNLPINIEGMSRDERLRLLEELWDSLDPKDVPLTEAQAVELDRRVADAERDGWSGIPWEDVLDRLKSDKQ